MPESTQNTDMVIKFKSKQFHVPEGFTAEEYVESLAMIYPQEAANAKLIEESDGVFVLKPLYHEKG
ncbi:hypothetical protein [Geoalkalibacter subterraneus]|uniref:Uncharacterized protein n=1 Tax=Geoalkalibacter subterraneus TaxID=483547 RepID=A0A0B5FJE7_9BACT|nr:hypothetical protein [Geoalkalibacter subterraneus]AJF08292.1 hypothetical protein GSUB_17605 [Geoalkalibacter subterraneus]